MPSRESNSIIQPIATYRFLTGLLVHSGSEENILCRRSEPTPCQPSRKPVPELCVGWIQSETDVACCVTVAVADWSGWETWPTLWKFCAPGLETSCTLCENPLVPLDSPRPLWPHFCKLVLTCFKLQMERVRLHYLKCISYASESEEVSCLPVLLYQMARVNNFTSRSFVLRILV